MFDWPALVGAARLPARSRFRRVYAFDTEFSADRARRLACIQWLWFDLRSGEVSEPRIAHAHDDEGASAFRAALADPKTLIVGLNTSIDMWVGAAAWGLRREVAEAYAQRRVGDVMLRELFEHLARPAYEAWMRQEPLDPEDAAGQQGRRWRVWRKKRWSVGAGGWDPYVADGGSVAKGLARPLRRVSMAAILWRRFGLDVTADKGPDSWRLRYGELIDVPLAEWPEEAVRYALQDAPKTLAPWLSQCSRPERQPFDRPELRWWDKLAGGPDGALLLAHEADRANYAWVLQDIACGPGFPVDHEYAQEVRDEYAALEEAALAVMRGCKRWRAEDGREVWAEDCFDACDALEVEEVEEVDGHAIDPVRGTIKRNPPADEARRLYLPSDVAPALTDTGRKKAAEYEGRPLREWPEAARGYVSTSGHSVCYVLSPRTDDAAALVKDPIKGLGWPAERVAAAIRATASPLLAGKNVAKKAHTIGGVVDRFLGTDAANPDYWPLLRTGRVSARGDLPQNLSQKGRIRECLRPREGHALLVADYGQIELVAFAWLLDRVTEAASGYPANSYTGPLTAAINAGQDAHILLGLELLRRPEGWDHDRAKRLRKAIEGALEAHGHDVAAAREAVPGLEWDFGLGQLLPARQKAKAGNYGYGGGMGPRGFVRAQARQGTLFTIDEAAEIRRLWWQTWQVAPYFDMVSDLDAKARKLKCGISVRVPGSGMLLGGGTYTQSANVLFQGLCAMLLAQAADRVWRACEGLDGPSPLAGGRIVHLIHDETIAEVPVGCAEEALPELQRLMLAPAAELLPGMLVTTSGAILTDRWRKC